MKDAPAAPSPLTTRRPTGSAPLQQAVVHVDLDGVPEIFEARGWDARSTDDSLFLTGLRNALDFFDRHDVRATLFLVARSLDDPRRRALVEEAIRRGHEIAGHTLTHASLRGLPPDLRRRELVASRQRIEQELGVAVQGFRAPGYAIDNEAARLLVEAGYRWDSSLFLPRSRPRRPPSPGELEDPHPFPGCELLELALPRYAPLPLPFSPSYALLFGTSYFELGLHLSAGGGPFVLLFHLIDFSDPLRGEAGRGLRRRIYTLSTRSAAAKLARLDHMFGRVARRYEITTTPRLLARYLRSGAESPAR